MKAFKQYFSDEMRSLHDEAQRFAEEFPEQAAMLNLKELRDKDPYIERLLEGVAFLTAQVRQQIDNSQTQMNETLLEQIAPELLRPIPALTIMEFKPKINSQHVGEIIPNGLEIFSQDLDGGRSPIGFTICDRFILYPIHLKYCQILSQELQLTFQTLPHTNFEQLNLKEIPIYLHAEPLLALDLFMLLTQQVTAVEVEYSKQVKRQVFSPSMVTAHHVHRLLPDTGRTWVGLGLLQDYFAFREKYFFIKLTQLEFLKDLEDIQEVKVIIRFSDHYVLPKELTRDNFKLHCIPAVNLIESYSEPIQYNRYQLDYSVIADYTERETMIYDIVSIEANYNDSRSKYSVRPFYKLNKTSNDEACYHIVKHFYDEKNYQIKVSFANLENSANLSLQTKLLIFHGNQPRKILQEGNINRISNKYLSILEAKNLIRPSSMLLPPCREHYQQQLLGLLQKSFNQIDNRENFCNLLQQLDWTKRRENKQRIDGIKELTVEPIEKFLQGCLVSGWRWKVFLDSTCYASISDAYHFGWFLHQFLLTYNNLNEVIETAVLLEPGQEEWLWQE